MFRAELLGKTATNVKTFSLWRFICPVIVLISLIGASVGCYFASLCFDCYYTGPKGMPGHILLLSGWFSIFDGQFVWLANPAWFIAWMPLLLRNEPPRNSSNKYGASVFVTSVGLALSLSFLLHKEAVAADGPIRAERIIAYGPGYYLWVSSFILQLIFFVLMRRCIFPVVSQTSEATSSDVSESATS